MKHLKLLTAAVILILLISSITATSYIILNKQKEPQKPFYVGVTYCGSSIQEAKELIDTVKNYTNLFTLLSGPLRDNITAMIEIGDYACASNLKYAIFGSTKSSYGGWINNWTVTAKARWGEQFIGLYYMDEPGGNILDSGGDIATPTKVNNEAAYIIRTPDGKIRYAIGGASNLYSNDTTYFPDGRITVNGRYEDQVIEQEFESLPEENQPVNGTIVGTFKTLNITADYYTNRTITIEETIDEGTLQYTISQYINAQDITKEFSSNVKNTEKYNINFYTAENITKYPYAILTYEEILKQHPLQTIDNAAEIFIDRNKNNFENIKKEQLQEEKIIVFTADYGLYWWDYQSGYDVILAELGWNHTMSQDIGLVRGAANMQGKSWGTIITWKYTHAPYLTDGEEMFEQMKTSYEAGAEYVLIFNYSEDQENPNTLQEEHYQALEQFWNDIVQNPKIKHGNIKTEAALVLPQNYGWGMRHPQDTIWGIWPADETSQQIWSQLQSKLEQHGLKLDIVFEDPNYPAAWKYFNIYYWDQK
jgi:hypothetical protein